MGLAKAIKQLVKRVIGQGESGESPAEASFWSDADIEAVRDSAEQMARVINESLEIARETKGQETKESRVRVAREKLDQLYELQEQFHFLNLDNNEDVEKKIAEMESEVARTFGGSEREGHILTDRQYQDSDVIEGLEFAATLQITTPLSVLEHHGEVFEGEPNQAPQYGGQSQGIWVPKLKSWEELGINAKEIEDTMASDAGEVKVAEYLPFLKDFRRLVEDDDLSIPEKMKRIEKLANQGPTYEKFIHQLKKNKPDFPRSFFYEHLTELPGVGPSLAQNLFVYGYMTVESVSQATDEELLEVRGLGRKTLAQIRNSLMP